MEQQLQGVEAKATLAEQQLAQRIATGQAELDAATERAQLQAGLAEVSHLQLDHHRLALPSVRRYIISTVPGHFYSHNQVLHG